MVHQINWSAVTAEHVNQAIHAYNRLGATAFFATHGFAPTTTYDLMVHGEPYPPKAILGTAFEFATGQRLAPADFEGGRDGAVRILTALGFDVHPRTRDTVKRDRG